jgi:hypothetical protein
VPQRVRDQVGDHAVERPCIDDDLEIGRNGDRHRAMRQGICERSDQLHDLVPKLQERRRDPDRLQIQAGEIEKLFGQLAHANRLLHERAQERPGLFLGQLVSALLHRRADPVDAGQRVPQLVNGEGDELALQHVAVMQLVAEKRVLEQG